MKTTFKITGIILAVITAFSLVSFNSSKKEVGGIYNVFEPIWAYGYLVDTVSTRKANMLSAWCTTPDGLMIGKMDLGSNFSVSAGTLNYTVPAQSFASLTGKPTTLSGYGITNAYPLTGNPSGFLLSEVDGSIANEIELASQTGNSGKYLTTNGTTTSWATAAPTVPIPTAIAAGNRNFNQAYQISSTRPTTVSVTPSIVITIGVLGSVTGQSILEISANGSSGWIYIGEVANQSSTIGLSTTNRAPISADLPSGYYWRLRTVNTITGLNTNPTYSFSGGSEWVY